MEIHVRILMVYSSTLIDYVKDIVGFNLKSDFLEKKFQVKELYTETPNSDVRKLCTVLCGRNVNIPPTEVEGKGLQL